MKPLSTRELRTNRLGLLFAGVALAAMVGFTPSSAEAQTRDRGSRYQRATGGGGGSAAPSRASPSRSAPSRSSPGRTALDRGDFARSDGRSRTRTNDNSRANRSASPSANSRGRTVFRDAGRGDFDAGDRYGRASTAAGRDYGSYRNYGGYNSYGAYRPAGRLGYGRPYGYGGVGYGAYNSYGYSAVSPYYRPYYGSRFGFGVNFRDDYRYDGGYGYGYEGAFADDPYHVPSGYYYQAYRYTPVYRGFGGGYGYNAVPAYGGSYNNSAAVGYSRYRYNSGAVRSAYSYSSAYSSRAGYSPVTSFSTFGYAGDDYSPFAFGCAPRTSVSYGLSFSSSTGGSRYYPRYSYRPAYGSSVRVGVSYQSR